MTYMQNRRSCRKNNIHLINYNNTRQEKVPGILVELQMIFIDTTPCIFEMYTECSGFVNFDKKGLRGYGTNKNSQELKYVR